MDKRLKVTLVNPEERFISALAMPFRRQIGYCLLINVLLLYFFTSLCFGGERRVDGLLIEGVVATVEDEAITLRELHERYKAMKKTFPNITIEEVLTTMINRIIILREARLLRIEESRSLYSNNDDWIIDEYIDVKIKANINIKEEKIQDYYEEYKSAFRDRPYYEVAEDIERLLIEQRANELLKEHIEELRRKHYIKIIVIPEEFNLCD